VVNLGNPAQVHGALDRFIQGSPALSRAATSKTPLPKSFLTPPAGGKQGDQHLPEIMRATGVDNNLPTKQKLQIGAKSMYMPVSGQDELDAYMEQRLAEKGPRSAAGGGGGGGFFKPHPAKGANAHAQLKPDAKVADHKKVDQARQQARAETHGLLMSALQQAAQTGDYSQANALEVKYQLTGGIETFALLMGYQAVDMGAQTGIVVLDRSALNINPTPILGTHRPADNPTNYPMPHFGQKAQVLQIDKVSPIWTARVIKGGEGSGNFHHAGRPGEVGGSAAQDAGHAGAASTAAEPSASQSTAGHYQAGRRLEPEDLDVYGKDLGKLPSDKNTYKDPFLASVLRAQGFDGLPQVVDADTFAQMEKDGEFAVTLYRGVDESGDLTRAQVTEQFRSGPLFVGEGISGNGTYASTARNEAFDKYARGHEDGLLTIGLRKDAKIVPNSFLSAIYGEYKNSDKPDRGQFLFKLMNDAVQAGETAKARALEESMQALNHGLRVGDAHNVLDRVYWDPGALASFLGYDAIQVHEDRYILLNRTALVVQGAKHE
jgi:hypothetical protein